jgi:hypothetical protein
MKKIFLISMIAFASLQVMAQKKVYSTKTGTTFFDAGTGVEDISGTNKATVSAFDAISGQIQFQIMVKGFEFWSQLMQDHFNENYMESDKFPKSTFNGKITNIDKVNFSKDGSYPVTVKGTLEIHGVKKDIETTGTMKVNGEKINATSEFIVIMDDYKIAIPGVVKDKLSKTAKIKINCTYSPLKQ